MTQTKLDSDAVAGKLKDLTHWTHEQDRIAREFQAKTARHALQLIQRIGDLAEGANHHPELQWVHRRLRIELTTHDAGGITLKDFHLAQCIEGLFSEL